MVSINYLLYESAAGYAVFEVTNQADSVGLQLKEVQDSFNNLATFSKHVKLVSFAPYQYVVMMLLFVVASAAQTTDNASTGMPPRHSRTST